MHCTAALYYVCTTLNYTSLYTTMHCTASVMLGKEVVCYLSDSSYKHSNTLRHCADRKGE